MVISIVAVLAQPSDVGVKVYVDVPVVDVVIVAGLHVPVILLFDVDGSDGRYQAVGCSGAETYSWGGGDV